MSTPITSPARGKSWVFQVTALCIVLGMLLALSLKTQRQVASENGPNRLPALQAMFRLTKQDNDRLQRELADYKLRYEKLLRDRTGATSSEIEHRENEARLMAGTVPVHGPGVVVVLRDSPKRDPAETRDEIISQYIVHDYDIRSVVNELFAAGAEAISVNGQRMIANSSVRCAGPVVVVNGIPIGPDYVIKAIGKPDTLKGALFLPGGDAEGLFLLDMIEVKKESDITVPSYSGSTRFSIARPVKK